MAKKIDSNGKITEASDEELREALQREGGIIKQTVTMPDGSRKEFAVWGGYYLDGLDRTTNVFMNHEDIDTFIEIVRKGTIDPNTLKDPCEFEDGIQVSVEFLDLPVTLIYRRSQGKISTARYLRDVRKTFSKTFELGTGEIDLNEDGKTFELGTGEIDLNEDGDIPLNRDFIEKNPYFDYLVVLVAGVRRYLMKEGIAQKLYDMFDESAGVVLKVSKAGKISAKIVKGMERPDLPCMDLLGVTMYRPYIDERLGLKSGGKRTPKDPEQIKKNKEDDEKAKKEKRKKELAITRTCLTLTYRKLSKAKAKVEEVKADVEPENDKKKTIKAEVSAAEAAYKQIKSELQSQIYELERKKKELEKARKQEEKSFKATENRFNEDIQEKFEEAKKAQATFEVISEVADFWKAKADKGIFSKKKNQAMYSEKQAEADRAKTKVEEILKSITDLKIRLHEENKRYASNEKNYSLQKSQIDSELTSIKDSLEIASSECYEVRKKLNAQVKEVNNKKKVVKEAEKKVTALEEEIADLENDIKNYMANMRSD